MRILLAHKFFRLTGGADVFFLETGNILKENGHDIAYFSTKHPENIKSEWSDYFVEAPLYDSDSTLDKLSSLGQIIYSRNAKKVFARLIKDFNPDVIHVFAIYIHLTPSILDAAKEAGIPVVMSCNDYKHICPNYKLYHHGKVCYECKSGRYYKAITNRCAKNSMIFSVASAVESYVHSALDIYRRNIDLFLFSSNFMAQKTIEFWDENTFQWGILKNPFESTEFSIHEERGNYILYFGRLIDEKGLEILFDAMKTVTDTRLVVVGNGPMEAELKLKIQNEKLDNIEMVGPKWGEELNEYLFNCNFVVVPSLWHENYPYVINQSFAVGKPVVGSNRGGITELIGEDRGVVYEATNSGALADAINDLCTNKDKLQKMAHAAKKWSDTEFNYKKYYDSVMSVYNKVLEQ